MVVPGTAENDVAAVAAADDVVAAFTQQDIVAYISGNNVVARTCVNDVGITPFAAKAEAMWIVRDRGK